MKYFISGATGSIGSMIVDYLAEKKQDVKGLTHSEFRTFEAQQKTRCGSLEKRLNVDYVIGDIRDKDKLEFEMRGYDIVIHCAALKHVYLCYENAIESVKTNIIGTQNIIEAAIKTGIKKVILISTDKAVNPISVMGATKFIAERLILSANNNGKTKFSVVRLGNVEGTSGSVIPIFEKQIREGGPVTVTHPEMTRFMMHPLDVVRLIFKALGMMEGGEIFVPKMDEIKILDMAKKMIERREQLIPTEIKIVITGMKPGEKIHEELLTPSERYKAKETKDMWII